MQKRGKQKKGMLDPSETSNHSTSIPGQGSKGLQMSQKVPFLNSDLLTGLNGPKNIAPVRIDGESSWALVAQPSMQ